jgi:surface antigen
MLGAVLGGATGAVVGSQIGKGTGKLIATATGTVVGFLLGGNIGRSMDEVDQNCVGQVLEHARDTQPVVWQDPDGPRYEVKPTSTYRNREGRYCREYQTTVIIGGRTEQAHGTACRQPDGSWQRVS